MKIIHVISSLATGGAEKFAVELSGEQAQNPANHVILCSTQKIKNSFTLPKKLPGSVKLVSLEISKKYSLKLISKLYAVIKKEKPQVVHVHLHNAFYHVFFVSLFFRKIRFIHTIHSQLAVWRKIFRFVNTVRFIANHFHHVCVSKQIFLDFKAAFPALKYFSIDNGIQPIEKTANFLTVKSEVEAYKTSQETKVFIAAGNYSRHKNFSMLARIFKRLETNGDDVVLLIIGKDSSPGATNYREVEEIKGKTTHLLGAKENVSDYLLAADAFVISSLVEGMPLVVLEAFSAGLPVVATPAGGLTDLVKEGENGFIAGDCSEDSLFQAVERFLDRVHNKPSAIEQIKQQNIQEFQEKYSMATCQQRYAELYSQ